jgi:SAM-dependent methyltransferase
MIDLALTRLRRASRPAIRLTPGQRSALRAFQSKLVTHTYTQEFARCLCGAETGLHIASYDRYGLAVPTELCLNCGTMWTSSRLDGPSLTAFYTEDYRPIYVGDAQAPDIFFREQVDHGDLVARFVESHLPPHSEARVVFDVGCGAGGMLLPFRQAGWRVYGCDVGEGYLARGRAAGLTLEHGDAATLAPYGPANLIILSHVLEHLSNPLQSLAQMHELLVDDGYLYIELPGIFHIHRAYGDTRRYFQNAHLYHFTLDTIAALLARAGFQFVAGDERIWALFKKDRQPSYQPPPDIARQVRNYLCWVELANMTMLLPAMRGLRQLVRTTLPPSVRGSLRRLGSRRSG